VAWCELEGLADDEGVVGSAMRGSQLRPRRSSQGDLACIESTYLMVVGLGAWNWISTTKADMLV
jgi:hypothetical protein